MQNEPMQTQASQAALTPVRQAVASVSIVLVAYHGDEWLPACIDSLMDAGAQRLHLVLVDNTGNTILDTLGLDRIDHEIIQTPHAMGFAEANNYALAHASRLEDAVLFLNQDTISRPGWIDQCLACFEQDQDLGAVSPFICTYDGTGWDEGFMNCIAEEDAHHRLASSDPNDADWFYTKNASAPALIVRTEVLERVGPFDPIFGSYYEDYDLCLRIREAGYQIAFCRSARVYHYSGSTTTTPARERKRMRQLIRNRLIYQVRALGRGPLLIERVCIDLPRRLVRGILRTPSSQPPSVTLKAHWDLLRVVGRVVSRRIDEKAWRQYLEELGWPHRIPGLQDRSRSA